jgi:hypothetical protein
METLEFGSETVTFLLELANYMGKTGHRSILAQLDRHAVWNYSFAALCS